jgi:beta-fructofuranosidase
VLAFTGHPHEMTGARIAESCEYCTWSLPSPGLLGPGDIQLARPFSAEPDLFAAPLAQLRDGGWVIVGFRNLEPEGIDAFEIIDPLPVTLDDEGYVAAR